MSVRDPYQKSSLISYDGTKKNAIRVFGNNQKNNHNFTIGWEVPQIGNVQRISNKVGNEIGFIIPDYTVITYKNMDHKSTIEQNQNLSKYQSPPQQQKNSFAQLAQKHLDIDNYQSQAKKEQLNRKKFEIAYEQQKAENDQKEQTNRQIQEILTKERRENQKYGYSNL